MITTSFNSGAGQISLSIGTTHTSVATISQIGQLRYAFDQTPDTLSIDRVQALYTYMNIDLLQYDDGGRDLWEVLISEADSATIQVTLEVVLPDGAFGFLFKIRKPDISLNERSGIVTLRLTPYIDESVTVQDVFDDITPKKQFKTTIGGFGNNSIPRSPVQTFYPAVGVKEFIIKGLNRFFGNNYENVFSSGRTELGSDYTEFVYDDLVNGKKAFTMVEATVDEGLDPAPLNNDIQIQGNGAITVLDVTDFEFEGRETIDYQLQATGAGLSVLRRGDKIFFTGGSVIGIQVDDVKTISGVVTAFITASEATMPVPRGESLVIGNWSYVRGQDPADLSVVNVLKDLAGIEGSIFGTGFSKNFYIHRLATDPEGDNTKTVNYNEVIEFRPFNFDLSLGKSFVGQLSDFTQFNTEFFGQWPSNGANSGVPNLSSGRSNTNGNFGASKGIEIELAPAYPLLNKGLVSSTQVDGTGIRGTDTNLESVLTRNGLKSYFQSLNASVGSIAVEFTVIGSQRVLPYELFQFDSRAPEKYRDKQFRITEVSYDFVQDTCKIKGYQISSITTPVVDNPRPRIAPPRVPPVFVGDPIGMLERAVDDETVESLLINFNNSSATGRSLLIVNDLEREQGYFQDNEAGQYEVTLNNGDVPNTEDAQFVGTNISDLPQGSKFTQINMRCVEAIELTAGSTITIKNISGQSQNLTVATTITTTASTLWPSTGSDTTIQVNEATAQFLYQGSYSYVHLAGYTAVPKRSTFPVGITEVPIQSSRINAPKGSFVYTSAPFDEEGTQITQAFTQAINLRLIDTDSNLVATQESLLNLVSTVSNVNGVVTAQGSFIVSLNSTVTNIQTDVTGQATAIFNLNTRVTAGEGYLISNASAIIAINSAINDPVTGLNASATAITLLETNVSNIQGNLVSQASAITAIQSNITGIEGEIDGIEFTINAQASAISILETNVSAIEGNIVSQASAITAIQSNITGIEGQIDAQASAISILETNVSVIEGNIVSQSLAITAIESNITGIEGEIDGQASALTSLNTRVTSSEGYISSNASALTALNATVTDPVTGLAATAFTLDQTNASVEVIDGKVSNISAKRSIVVGAGGKLAEISLSANDGDGSTGSSEISISADQVQIQDIFFDDDGAVYSNNFVTTGAPTTNGVITDGVVTRAGVDGWAFDRAGKLYADEPFFRNGDYNGGTQINMTYTDPIIIFPRLSISRADGTSIDVLTVNALEFVEVTVTGGGGETVNVRGITPITVGGNRIQTKITVMNNIDGSPTSSLIIQNENGSATNINRIKTPDGLDYTLNPGDAVELFYRANNNANDRWIVIATNRTI